MTNVELGFQLAELATVLEGESGFWRVKLNNRELTVITDATHNRMRIISAITDTASVEEGQYLEMLQAQFHKLLDVRYAIYNQVLWSVFTHPLQELSPVQLEDALQQVYLAAENFGSSYSSSPLMFGAGDG